MTTPTLSGLRLQAPFECEDKGAAAAWSDLFGMRTDACVFVDCAGIVRTYAQAYTGVVREVTSSAYLPAVVCPVGAYAQPIACPPGYGYTGWGVDIEVSATLGYRGVVCCPMYVSSSL